MSAPQAKWILQATFLQPRWTTKEICAHSPQRLFPICWTCHGPQSNLMKRARKEIIEGSLEVKLPTIWTDEKQRWEESEKRREEERRSKKRKSQKKERRSRCAKR